MDVINGLAVGGSNVMGTSAGANASKSDTEDSEGATDEILDREPSTGSDGNSCDTIAPGSSKFGEQTAIVRAESASDARRGMTSDIGTGARSGETDLVNEAITVTAGSLLDRFEGTGATAFAGMSEVSPDGLTEGEITATTVSIRAPT